MHFNEVMNSFCQMIHYAMQNIEIPTQTRKLLHREQSYHLGPTFVRPVLESVLQDLYVGHLPLEPLIIKSSVSYVGRNALERANTSFCL